MTTVDFPVAAEVAFDYLADPTNRSAWQSSLARVEDVSGEVAVGQSWTDVTRAGVRPRMRTTVLDRPHTWTECGTWRGIDAELTLTFEPTSPTSCRVRAEFDFDARGAYRLLAAGARLAAPTAIGPDLRRAAKLLAAR